MRTIFASAHGAHAPLGEFNRGKLVPYFESPRRLEMIRAVLQSAGIGSIEPARTFPLDAVLRVHDAAYIGFLKSAYAEWIALGRPGDATPLAWPIRGMRSDRVPKSLDGRLSFYSFDGMSPLTAGTWEAAKGAADTALTAATYLSATSERSIFALCRPPGHHAAADYLGGYCFLNNAAIAAAQLLADGAARVAILDVDYHHGNGTQSIFYARSDVLFASIHADPAFEYPYFLGYTDETGDGEGAGFNLNYPLPNGTDWNRWQAALDDACRKITDAGADAVVVSLGVDTFEGDPLGSFRLGGDDYRRAGQRLAALRLPTLFVMEGGYAVDEIGANVVNVLRGFEGG